MTQRGARAGFYSPPRDQHFTAEAGSNVEYKLAIQLTEKLTIETQTNIFLQEEIGKLTQ